MPRNSLKKLKDKFPYFLDKSDDSNFTKVQEVFNNRLVDVYNELFQVYLAGKLEKNLFIWKVQLSANEYVINFTANFPYLESVILYKNDEVIYNESFEYDDEVHTFNYSYESTSENIIPDDKFKILVTTHEEYTLSKAFPENDEQQGNEHDHDTSLDSFGAFYRIPRKNYKILTDADLAEMNETRIIDYYKKTEPPFNDRASEDDYHYMTRILSYISYFNKIPLPVLEVWKLYGLDPENPNMIKMTNREKYLCKMFEIDRHLAANGQYDESWTPERWEHKDSLICPVPPEIFFFAQVDNASPIEGQKINFTFNFYDALAKKSENNYIIVPYIKEDNEYVIFQESFYLTGNSWGLWTDEFPGIDGGKFVFDFIFRAYESLKKFQEDSENYLLSDEIRIIIKGCGNADLYVDCVTGNDSNNGTQDYPLKTLAKALTKVEGSNNVIALVNKNERFYIDNSLKITETCSIISCPKGAVIYQNNGWDIFKIMQDTRLYLQNVTLKHKCCELYASGNDFSNENIVNYPFNITIPRWICKIATKINMTTNITTYAHRNVNFTGSLLTDVGDYLEGAEITEILTSNCPTKTNDPNEPVPNEEMKLYLGDNLLDTKNTNNNGVYNFNHTFNAIGTFNLNIKHEESINYCNSEDYYTVLVEPMPTTLSANVVDKIYIQDSFDVDYNLVDYYNDEIAVGVIKLYENNRLVKTVDVGESLDYTPTVAGLHSYRIVFEHDETYVSSTANFKVNVVKYATNLILLGEGKSVYGVSENVKFTGILTDELDRPLSSVSVKVYDNNTLLTSLTTDNDGKVLFNRQLTEGTHFLSLTLEETPIYYASTSNQYRVRVRSTPLSDINLKLYPVNKILGSQSDLIPCYVYATNRSGTPLSIDFKIMSTYDGLIDDVYTTDSTGWAQINVPTTAIVNCHGTFLQAISVDDSDCYSNSVHIRDEVTPELTVSGAILTDESIYSYGDDVIHINGYLLDSEDDPVPSQDLTVDVIVDGTTVSSLNARTNVLGEFNTTFTTNNTIRGNDIKFKLNYLKHNKQYAAFTDETTVTFKQLSTRINCNNISVNVGESIVITGEVLDENNRVVNPAVLASVFNNGSAVNHNISNGQFSRTITDLLIAGNYNLELNLQENDYYKHSSKTVSVTVNKITPLLDIDTENIIPLYEEFHVPFRISVSNNRVPISGSVIITQGTTELVSVDALADTIDITFPELGEYNCKIKYNGNNYLNSVTKDIVFKVIEPSYTIITDDDSPWDINIFDTLPSDITPYEDSEYIITNESNNNYPQLIITEDSDYDDSGLDEEDIVLIDESDNPHILFINKKGTGS